MKHCRGNICKAEKPQNYRWRLMAFLVRWMRRITGLSLLISSSLCHAAEEGDITIITVTGTFIDAPECVVNAGGSVNVDFGDNVLINRINSGNYHQKIVFSLDCESLAQNGLTLAINGAQAGFGDGLLQTSVKGLGIQLYSGSQRIAVGEKMPFNYPVLPVLSASLVIDSASTLAAGEFTGVGTMVVSYQ